MRCLGCGVDNKMLLMDVLRGPAVRSRRTTGASIEAGGASTSTLDPARVGSPASRMRTFPYPPRVMRTGGEMSVEGLILHHGEAHGITLHQTRVDYLVTAQHSKQCSLFEFTVAPGFNTGAFPHQNRGDLLRSRRRARSALWRAYRARRTGNLRICPTRRSARVRKFRLEVRPYAADHCAGRS